LQKNIQEAACNKQKSQKKSSFKDNHLILLGYYAKTMNRGDADEAQGKNIMVNGDNPAQPVPLS
jgi:hypothetical protein